MSEAGYLAYNWLLQQPPCFAWGWQTLQAMPLGELAKGGVGHTSSRVEGGAKHSLRSPINRNANQLTGNGLWRLRPTTVISLGHDFTIRVHRLGDFFARSRYDCGIVCVPTVVFG